MKCFHHRDLFAYLCQFLDPPDILSLSEVNTRLQQCFLQGPAKSILMEEKAMYASLKTCVFSAKLVARVKRWYPGIVKMFFKYYPHREVKIPQSQLTYELCKLRVRRFCFNIRRCPKEFLTDELCMMAMNDSPYCVKDIPEEICRKNGSKYCVMAVDQGVRYVYIFAHFLLTCEQIRFHPAHLYSG